MHDEALSRNTLPEVMLIDEDERGMLVRLREEQLQENHLQIRDNIEQHEADGYVLKNISGNKGHTAIGRAKVDANSSGSTRSRTWQLRHH